MPRPVLHIHAHTDIWMANGRDVQKIAETTQYTMWTMCIHYICKKEKKIKIKTKKKYTKRKNFWL